MASIIEVPECVTRQHRPPHTTFPPAPVILARSPSSFGLWSSVRRTAAASSPVQSTARESPRWAV